MFCLIDSYITGRKIHYRYFFAILRKGVKWFVQFIVHWVSCTFNFPVCSSIGRKRPCLDKTIHSTTCFMCFCRFWLCVDCWLWINNDLSSHHFSSWSRFTVSAIEPRKTRQTNISLKASITVQWINSKKRMFKISKMTRPQKQAAVKFRWGSVGDGEESKTRAKTIDSKVHAVFWHLIAAKHCRDGFSESVRVNEWVEFNAPLDTI